MMFTLLFYAALFGLGVATALPGLKLLVRDDSKPNADLSSKGNHKSTHHRTK